MSDDYINIRKKHFTQNWLTWAALHHFLPAPLLRELLSVIVEQMSKGSLSLGHLFDETITHGPTCMDSWLIYPLKTDSPLAEYLQRCIRSFVWQSDPRGFFSTENVAPADAISSRVLDKAIELGIADFASMEQFIKDTELSSQPSFSNFTDAIKMAHKTFASSSRPDEFAVALEDLVKSIEMPLASVVIKHLGDLCADTDAWDKAQALYERANHKVLNESDSAWDELTESLRTIMTQSRAAAISTLTGDRPAADLLIPVLAQTKIQSDPLLFANASFDAYVADAKSSDLSNYPRDQRVAVLRPPLFHETHSLSPAFRDWLREDYESAHRLFWAVLRRQIALGLATESRSTKAHYARSLLEELDQTVDRQARPQAFYMAIRLLLESGNNKSVTKIRWNDNIVDAYVDQPCVDFVITHAQAHKGSQLERDLVVVELFRAWTERISIDRTDVATSMLKHIARLSLRPSSFMEDSNIGGRSLEVLQYIAQKRPELRKGIVSDVAAVVSQKLSAERSWRDSQVALETAIEYVDLFLDESLLVVLDATLTLLDRISPDAGMWIVVRPALTLLTAKAIKDFARQKPEYEQRIVTTIIRFGKQQETEHANVLFYLHDFDQKLLRDKSLRDDLRNAVNFVRQSANKINSSNVVNHIQALLIAPVISGTEGVKDALNGLTLILRSAKETHHSIALPYAYDPLILLADRQAQIASDLNVSLDIFRSWLKPLIPLITDLWNEAKEKPLLFATFSLPPATKPDPIIIHNWAFASIRLAKTLQQDDQIQVAINSAESQPALQNAISLARATRSAYDKDDKLDVETICTENRDLFYSALGRRLVMLQRLDEEQGREVCKALLDQCLRVGPRGIDAAVFLSAINMNLGRSVRQTSLSDYSKRLENDRDLLLALGPILEMLRDGESSD